MNKDILYYIKNKNYYYLALFNNTTEIEKYILEDIYSFDRIDCIHLLSSILDYRYLNSIIPMNLNINYLNVIKKFINEEKTKLITPEDIDNIHYMEKNSLIKNGFFIKESFLFLREEVKEYIKVYLPESYLLYEKSLINKKILLKQKTSQGKKRI